VVSKLILAGGGNLLLASGSGVLLLSDVTLDIGTPAATIEAIGVVRFVLNAPGQLTATLLEDGAVRTILNKDGFIK